MPSSNTFSVIDAIASRSIRISDRVFVPSTFLSVVCASNLVENCASFTFVTLMTGFEILK